MLKLRKTPIFSFFKFSTSKNTSPEETPIYLLTYKFVEDMYYKRSFH